MKKLLLILLCFSVFFIGCVNPPPNKSEDSTNNETIIEKEGEDLLEILESKNTLVFKDGKSLEKLTKDEFVNGMAKVISRDNGGEYEKNKQVCECLIEEVSKEMTSLEFKNLFKNGLDFLANNIDQKIIDKTIKCIKSKGLLDYSIFSPDTFTEEQLKIIIAREKSDIRNSLPTEQYNQFIEVVDIDGYCECYIKGLHKEFGQKMIGLDLTNAENSHKDDLIIADCMKINQK